MVADPRVSIRDRAKWILCHFYDRSATFCFLKCVTKAIFKGRKIVVQLLMGEVKEFADEL